MLLVTMFAAPVPDAALGPRARQDDPSVPGPGVGGKDRMSDAWAFDHDRVTRPVHIWRGGGSLCAAAAGATVVRYTEQARQASIPAKAACCCSRTGTTSSRRLRTRYRAPEQVSGRRAWNRVGRLPGLGVHRGGQRAVPESRSSGSRRPGCRVHGIDGVGRARTLCPPGAGTTLMPSPFRATRSAEPESSGG